MKVEIVYAGGSSRTLGNVTEFLVPEHTKDKHGNVVLGRLCNIEQEVKVDDTHSTVTRHTIVLDHEVLYLVCTDNAEVIVVPNVVRTFTVVPNEKQLRIGNAKYKEFTTVEHRKVTKARHIKREKERAERVKRKEMFLSDKENISKK